jgi:hypothetical protein
MKTAVILFALGLVLMVSAPPVEASHAGSQGGTLTSVKSQKDGVKPKILRIEDLLPMIFVERTSLQKEVLWDSLRSICVVAEGRVVDVEREKYWRPDDEAIKITVFHKIPEGRVRLFIADSLRASWWYNQGDKDWGSEVYVFLSPGQEGEALEIAKGSMLRYSATPFDLNTYTPACCLRLQDGVILGVTPPKE